MLEGLGQRVQGSVFECRLDDAELQTAVARLQRELGDPSNGNIRFYRACGACEPAAFGFGNLVSNIENDSCVIL